MRVRVLPSSVLMDRIHGALGTVLDVRGDMYEVKLDEHGTLVLPSNLFQEVKLVTRGGLKEWRGGGRFNYTTIFPQGLRVKVRPRSPMSIKTEYFLDEVSFFKENTFERHDATYYGVVFTEEEVMEVPNGEIEVVNSKNS